MDFPRTVVHAGWSILSQLMLIIREVHVTMDTQHVAQPRSLRTTSKLETNAMIPDLEWRKIQAHNSLFQHLHDGSIPPLSPPLNCRWDLYKQQEMTWIEQCFELICSHSLVIVQANGGRQVQLQQTTGRTRQLLKHLATPVSTLASSVMRYNVAVSENRIF